MSNNVSTLTNSPVVTRPASNGGVVDLDAGRPVMRKWQRASDFPEVITPVVGLELGEFAGVLRHKLKYNAIGDIGNSALVSEGRARAHVYTGTASQLIAGCSLRPLWTSAEGAHFRYSAYNTGIRLVDALTAEDDSTLLTDKLIEIDGAGSWGPILHYLWMDPAAPDADGLLNDQATDASVITTVTSFLTTLDYARNLVITPGGTTADVPAGDVTVTGTNIYGEVITEAFTFAANATGAVTGAKAFKTITSIVFPIQDGAAATYDVGWGAKLGLGRTFAAAPALLKARADGTDEGTAPTFAADVDDVESNTVSFNTAADGAKDFNLWVLAA